MGRRPSFRERYEEYKYLGYADHEIPRRMGITARSLVRMMARHGIEPSELLRSIASEERYSR